MCVVVVVVCCFFLFCLLLFSLSRVTYVPFADQVARGKGCFRKSGKLLQICCDGAALRVSRGWLEGAGLLVGRWSCFCEAMPLC